MKDVISVDKVIVNYRIKCDIDLSDREELLISQEEYEEAIQFNLNRSKEDIHSLLISKLPEKMKDRTGETPEGTTFHKADGSWVTANDFGYNSAIDDVKVVLAEMFNIKEKV